MNKETIQDLLVTKFYASPKDRQSKLLEYMLENANNKDQIVDFLNGKKLRHDERGFAEKDYILVPTGVTSYPHIDVNYYRDNDLIINDVYIRVQVNHINPITGYIGLNVVLESSPEEGVVEVYYGNIPNQKQIKIM
jgi:hypothetical protein